MRQAMEATIIPPATRTTGSDRPKKSSTYEPTSMAPASISTTYLPICLATCARSLSGRSCVKPTYSGAVASGLRMGKMPASVNSRLLLKAARMSMVDKVLNKVLMGRGRGFSEKPRCGGR